MAQLASTPASGNLLGSYSTSGSTSSGVSSTLFKTLDSDGSVYDFSVGSWTAQVKLLVPTPINPLASQNAALVVDSATAAGLAVSMAASTFATVAGYMTGNTAKMTIFANNGTDDIIVGTGSIILSVVP